MGDSFKNCPQPLSGLDDGLTGLGFHAKQSYYRQNYGETEGSPCLI